MHNLQAILRIHDEVSSQVVDHDCVCPAPLWKLAPDHSKWLHLSIKYVNVVTHLYL